MYTSILSIIENCELMLGFNTMLGSESSTKVDTAGVLQHVSAKPHIVGFECVIDENEQAVCVTYSTNSREAFNNIQAAVVNKFNQNPKDATM